MRTDTERKEREAQTRGYAFMALTPVEVQAVAHYRATGGITEDFPLDKFGAVRQVAQGVNRATVQQAIKNTATGKTTTK
jgi:hypothetical protein